MNKLLYVLLLLPFIGMGQTITLTDSDVLAFPAATGHGKNTTGGRGYASIQVTNLNNSGTGSLRDAIDAAETAGGGIIVFTTGGTIELTSRITITGDNITIAGETAPGDGIAIHGEGITMEPGENIIIRNIRIRPGDGAAADDAVRINQTSASVSMDNYMFDHLSISWGGDENISMGGGRIGGAGGVTNVSITNCIISESFSSGSLIFHWSTNISYIGNFFAHQGERNPHSSTDNTSFEIINNVLYHFNIGIDPTTQDTHDIIGNVLYDGPATANASIKLQACINNCDPDITSGSGTSYYIDDNTFNGADADSPGGRYNDQAEAGAPVMSSGYTAIANANVEAYVSANAGARATMEGVDSLDNHMFDDLANGSSGGYVSAEDTQYGLPTLAAGTAYTDTDGDGLSNTYELAQGGTTTSIVSTVRPATAEVTNGTIDQSGVTSYASLGYTHMEIFMADLAGDWDAIGFSAAPVNYNQLKPKLIRLGSNKGGAYLGSTKIKG